MSFKRTLNELRRFFNLKLLQKIVFVIIIILGLLTGIVIAQIIITFRELKDIRPLGTYSTYSFPTQVFDINGELITEFYKQKRILVSYKDLPDALIKAIIAIEDNYFYSHKGFNPIAMFKGAFLDPIFKGTQRGGSTITQQLAKGLFTTGAKTITRKLIELWYAMQIEKKYSKEEILELYFNWNYFGHGCYGVEAASQFFFDKSTKDLNVAEASLLAGLVNSPSAFSPILQPYKAQARHRAVLNAMVKMNFLTKEEADKIYEDFWENYSDYIKAKDINIHRSSDSLAPYFSMYVRGLLLKKYGEELLYNGGLKIYTTLDLRKQAIAEKLIYEALSNEQIRYNEEVAKNTEIYRVENEDLVELLSLVYGIDSIKLGNEKMRRLLTKMTSDYSDLLYLNSFVCGLNNLNENIKFAKYELSSLLEKKQDQIEGAFIAINPTNGYIEAMVGGKQFSYINQFNRAVLAKRNMGSLFKPIYYTYAIDNRIITPASVFDDKPLIYQDEVGNYWAPRNYDGIFRGPMRVRHALQLSVNLVAIQIWDLLNKTVGYNTYASAMASYFGMSVDEFKKRVKPQFAYALGVGVFSPYEVVQPFAAIANNGVWVEPIAILRVKDRFGKVIDDFEALREKNPESKKRVISEQGAFIMQDVLSDVLYRGTGATAAKMTGFNKTAGGKTGTTPNWKDAWFGGFTKDVAAVVWIGFDDSRKTLGKHRSAAVLAAPIWMKYIMQAYTNIPDKKFIEPDGIVQANVCGLTGLLASDKCPNVIREYFFKGYSPNKICDKHTGDIKEDFDYIQYEKLTNYMRFDIQIDSPLLPKSKGDNLEKDAFDFGEYKIDFGLE